MIIEKKAALPRWLVVGSTGRVGRMVSTRWHQAAPQGVDVIFQQRQGVDGAQFLNWPDLGNCTPLLENISEQGKIDCMFVLAGATGGAPEELKANFVIADACVRAARSCGIPRVLIASSSAVYGVKENHLFFENDQPNPVNAYGGAKLDMELALNGVRDIEVGFLRIGNVAGADALLLNLYGAKKKKELLIDQFEDGAGPYRSYIGPITLSNVLEILARMPLAIPRILNVAAPGLIAMADLAEAAGASWRYVSAPSEAYQSIGMDTSLLQKIYNFEAGESTPKEMIKQIHSLGF